MDAQPGRDEPDDRQRACSKDDPEASAFEVTVNEAHGGARRTLKQGDSFAVLSDAGTLRADTADGLYHLDTRHLSRLELALNGQPPMLLSSTIRQNNTELVCDLTNPEQEDGTKEGGLRADSIHVRREQFLWRGTFHERLSVRNYWPQPVELELRIAFAADFADIFEVRGTKRETRGTLRDPEVGDGAVRFQYCGLDGVTRASVLQFCPAPDKLDADCAVFRLSLDGGECSAVSMAVHFDAGDGKADIPDGTSIEAFEAALAAHEENASQISARAVAIESSNEIFNELARRSVADLYMLTTATEQGRYPYAGVPWFSTAFGRDGLVTAFQTLWLDPSIARGVLGFLAANQAREYDPDADAEPGKILHETRRSEMAMTGEVPFRRYYGSVDSTPLFIMLAGAYLARTGDRDFVGSLKEAIDAALAWMERDGTREGPDGQPDGFLWYGRKRDTGLSNQGWKDSWDSVFHADGTLAHAPIALVEVQGYAYAAWRAAADIFRTTGDEGRADAMEERAAALKRAFDATFWNDDLGTYVIALDGDRKPCAVRSSNVGHALWTGIVPQARVEAVVKALMDEDSFSGWGVRTVPEGAARYNPMSYHDGSVWPHDNALIGMGLARTGHGRDAARILRALFEAAQHVEQRRLPELFCGFPRVEGRGPTSYPVACSPQAWAAGAPLALLGACLGMRFDGAAGLVELCDPVMPDFLDELELRGVCANGGCLDIHLRRMGDDVSVSARNVRGTVRLNVRYG